MIGELDSTGNLIKTFVYASKSHVPDYFVDNSNTKYKLLTDQLGSVRFVVNSTTGEIKEKMNHDEFGKVLVDTNPNYIPFGFASGIYDSETKLVRFGVRDYDSVTGRWTSKDPINFKGGDPNLYGYVMNDPINLIDPLGKKSSNPWERVKKCKKMITTYLEEQTCDGAKKIKPKYECSEWDDNLDEILNPKNWLDDNKNGDKK